MSNHIFNDISIPCFDLTWVELPPPESSEEDESQCYAFVAGGGGNKTKSGVLNKIVVFKFSGATGMETVSTIECEHGLCESLCSAVVDKRVLLCASYQEKCVLMEVFLDEKSKIRTKDLSIFGVEELQGEDMSINASCFVNKKENFIVTGGENGNCHIWKVNANDKEKWTVRKAREFQHHKGPIKSINSHPTQPWVCTGGEDGICRIIDVENLTLLTTVHCTSDGVGAGSGPVPQCRACSFSNDGDYLFTVQSGRKGNAHIVKWEIKMTDEAAKDGVGSSSSKKKKNSKSHNPVYSVSPDRVVCAGKFPVTRLSMNINEPYLALGDCNGAITTFNTETLQKIYSYQCHDFPVTGMGFAPRRILHESEYARDYKAKDILFSCSADNKLSTILVQEPNMLKKAMWFLLIILILVAYFLKP